MLLPLIRANDIVGLSKILKSQSSHSSNELGEALIVASQKGNDVAVELLLSHGAIVDYIPQSGDLTDYSPLYSAALFGHKQIAELLIKHNANVNLTPASHGMTPLAAAIDYEADTASQIGEVPKMLISGILLDAGADPNICNLRGQSALDLARIYNYQEAIQRFTTRKY